MCNKLFSLHYTIPPVQSARLLPFALFILVLFALPAGAFDGDAAVITGDNVRVRTEAKSTAPVAATLRAGSVVRILEKSAAREKLGAGDRFGYNWYKVNAGRNIQGWVYGQFVYGMNGDRFVADNTLLYNPFSFSGKQWQFGVAEEPAYPVSDDTGLTGSVIHALPFFFDEKSNRTIFIQCEKTAYDLGEPTRPPALFRLNDSDGGTQKIRSITINPKTMMMIIEGIYETQTGGGRFSLSVKISRDSLVLAEFKKIPDTNK